MELAKILPPKHGFMQVLRIWPSSQKLWLPKISFAESNSQKRLYGFYLKSHQLFSHELLFLQKISIAQLNCDVMLGPPSGAFNVTRCQKKPSRLLFFLNFHSAHALVSLRIATMQLNLSHTTHATNNCYMTELLPTSLDILVVLLFTNSNITTTKLFTFF